MESSLRIVQVEVPPVVVVNLVVETLPMATPALVAVENVNEGVDPALA